MIHLESSANDSGKRLDHYLHEHLPDYSRARLQEWIKAGRVEVNHKPQKASYLLHGSESIAVEPAALAPLHAQPEDLPLEILYEDQDLIAVHKPAGMVVHSGAGRYSGTLVNALLHRFQALSKVGGELRPGIVHRLDRLTSGVILVARTDASHRHLAEQFASRKVEKIYLALVHGRMKADRGKITTPITRDPVRRIRMTSKLAHGRPAITEYQVLRRFDKFSLVEVRIGTGRTHQIRVHLASLGHPVAGDKLYGAPASTLGRYFLHAQRITFTSPGSGERITVEAPVPGELREFLDSVDSTSSRLDSL
jgi:23S rRNA pseudouridine1911/1915/1917 synthase